MIKVIQYNYKWPELFEMEAAKIKKAFGDNCIAFHHIGSTAVPGLSAKPIIDMLPVVQNIREVDKCNAAMEALGYETKGEYGIPLRRFFQKSDCHVHVFEQGNSEIGRHLKFRDWLRTHPDDRDAYANLKTNLAKKFPNDRSSYCFGKDEFIAEIDEKSGWKSIQDGCKGSDGENVMANKIKTRKYQLEDARALADIYYYTIHNVNSRDYSEEQLNAWAPLSSLKLDDWQKRWSKLSPIVALFDNKIVGFTEFKSNGYIDCFFVHHEFQGLGVGSVLMEAIEQEAKEKNIQRIFAEVSITAKPFFAKKGFKVVKQQTVVKRGCDLENFVMEKDFSSFSSPV